MAAKTLELPKMDIRRVYVKIEGTSPFIMNHFGKKSREEMAAKQQGKAKLKKAPKNPDDCYQDSMYRLGDHYGFPAGGVKKAIMRGAKYAGITMKDVGCSLHVIAKNDRNLIPVYGEPAMREDAVRNANGVADLRYRAEFSEWNAEFTVEYNARFYSVEQILSMVDHAGFHAGLGDWRPEKGGSFGMFTLTEATEVMSNGKH